MRKFLFSLIGVVALVLVAGAVYFGVAGNPFGTNEDAATSNIAEDEARDIVLTQEPDPTPVPAMEDSSMPMPPYAEQFKDLTFTLDAPLPEESGSRPAWKTNFTEQLSEDEMLEIGRQFGFDGPLYIERIPEEMMYDDEEYDVAVEDAELVDTGDETVEEIENVEAEVLGMYPGEFQPSYTMIDGNRRLNFYGTNANYQDMSMGDPWALMGSDDQLPFSEKSALAEAWLLERDLLPDNYVIQDAPHQQPMIVFFEVIDGIKLNRPVATVNMTPEGGVAYVDYVARITLERAGDFELNSIDEAFETLSAEPNSYQFNYFPSDEVMFPEMGMHKNWQREYGDDVTVTRSIWIQVYEAVDGGEPLLTAENMVVTGSAEIIEGLLEDRMNNVSATGTISEVDGNKVFNVTEFTRAGTPNEAYLNGTVERDGDNVFLTIAGGLRVLLPDAPDDLEDGSTVGVFGSAISDATDGPPVFDWINMDLQVDYSAFEEQMRPDFGPFSAKELSIDSITMIYQPWYPREPFMGSGGYYEGPYGPGGHGGETYIPMWEFSGVTNDGATLEFWVPAIDVEALAGN